MRIDLSRLREGMQQRDTVEDGRGELFFPGNVGATRVSELLCALPMVKGEKLPVTVPASTGVLSVLVKTAPSPLGVTTVWYDASTAPSSVPSLPLSEDTILLQRIGVRLQKLLIDDRVTPKFTAHNPAYWKVFTAATFLLRSLEDAIASGTGMESPPRIKGLSTLAAAASRTSASVSVEQDARKALAEVATTGDGAGEGPHCLIGSAAMLKTLMSTATGQRGRSGWGWDKMSGRFVYHYMGVPFYRCNVPGATTQSLFAANLGPTGLNLIYCHGSAGSFGLAADEVSGTVGLAIDDIVVRGAYGLALWEAEAIWEITGVTLVP